MIFPGRIDQLQHQVAFHPAHFGRISIFDRAVTSPFELVASLARACRRFEQRRSLSSARSANRSSVISAPLPPLASVCVVSRSVDPNSCSSSLRRLPAASVRRDRWFSRLCCDQHFAYFFALLVLADRPASVRLPNRLSGPVRPALARSSLCDLRHLASANRYSAGHHRVFGFLFVVGFFGALRATQSRRPRRLPRRRNSSGVSIDAELVLHPAAQQFAGRNRSSSNRAPSLQIGRPRSTRRAFSISSSIDIRRGRPSSDRDRGDWCPSACWPTWPALPSSTRRFLFLRADSLRWHRAPAFRPCRSASSLA